MKNKIRPAGPGETAASSSEKECPAMKRRKTTNGTMEDEASESSSIMIIRDDGERKKRKEEEKEENLLPVEQRKRISRVMDHLSRMANGEITPNPSLLQQMEDLILKSSSSSNKFSSDGGPRGGVLGSTILLLKTSDEMSDSSEGCNTSLASMTLGSTDTEEDDQMPTANTGEDSISNDDGSSTSKKQDNVTEEKPDVVTTSSKCGGERLEYDEGQNINNSEEDDNSVEDDGERKKRKKNENQETLHNSSQQREMWICDACKKVKFEDFEEACRHEEACAISTEAAKKNRAGNNETSKKRYRGSKNESNNQLSNGVVKSSPVVDNPLILSLVLDYLNNRDILQLFCCTKAIRRLSSCAYNQVIRSILIKGNTTQLETLVNLIYQIQLGRIYVPSIPRLLRLTWTGKGCELCGNSKKKRDNRCGENGVAFCHNLICQRKEQTEENSFKYKSFGKYNKYNHSRMAGRYDYTRIILLGCPHETWEGEWAGSILTYDDLPSYQEFDTILEERDKLHNPYKDCTEDIVRGAMKVMEEATKENCENHDFLGKVHKVLVKSGSNPNYRRHRPMSPADRFFLEDEGCPSGR